MSILACLAPSSPPRAATDNPLRPSFVTATLSPVSHIYGLPRSTEPLTPGRQPFTARLHLDWASHDTIESAAGTGVLFDGETQRLTLALSGPLPAGTGGWTLEAPYVRHAGGSLDQPIDTWHRLLGLPQGGRPIRPRNAVLFRVRDGNGGEGVFLDRHRSGPGDVALGLRLPLMRGKAGTAPATLGIRLEAPTGSPDHLLGSGGWDLAAWVGANRSITTAHGEVAVHGAAGLLGMTGSEVLSGLHRNWAGFGRLAAGFRPWRPITLRGQVDLHSPFYDSPARPLGGTAGEFRLGAGLDLTGWGELRLGVSEDLLVETAPDITFHLAWTVRLRGGPR
ncbi:DUF3187 family protein [Thiohalorhabdus sp. Cl-TMA]|uniref:DUF3187 family protein n=1 Tax=Thiohalorhabdus methylotrophus TaxID=3242694 RepID=A0ABV4TSU8_9GAMM